MLQAGITTGGAQCDNILAKGPPPRPYSKRDLEATLHKAFGGSYGLGAVHAGDNGRKDWNGSTWLSTFTVMVCIVLIFLAACLLYRLRYQSRTETVFQSPARNEGSVGVSQHYPEGSKTENLDGPLRVPRSIPPTGDTNNSVRRRLVHKLHDEETETKGKVSWRRSIAGSSTSTVVGDDQWTKDTENHDKLIELKRTDKTRNFLNPDTGETLHLSPWKSRKESRDDNDDNDDKQDVDKGDVLHTIAQMGVGSAVFRGGTAAEKPLHEKAQAEPHRHPQQTGDTLAGLVTNEPSVGDALKGTV